MRRTTVVTHAERTLPLSRGWIILGLALASWALFVVLWAGASQLFAFVLSAI